LGCDTDLFLKLHLDAIQSGFALIHPLPLFLRPDQLLCQNPRTAHILGSLFRELLHHFTGLVFLFFERRYLPVQKTFLAPDGGFPFLKLWVSLQARE